MAQRLATAVDLPPEFASTDAATLTYWLDMASAWIGLTAWGVNASRAHALLTAHFLKSSDEGTGGAHGTLTAQSAGPVSQSYAVATPTDAELGSTVYGSQFIALRRVCRPGPMAMRSSSIGVIPR